MRNVVSSACAAGATASPNNEMSAKAATLCMRATPIPSRYFAWLNMCSLRQGRVYAHQQTVCRKSRRFMTLLPHRPGQQSPPRGYILPNISQPFLTNFGKRAIHLDLINPDVQVVEKGLVFAVKQDSNVHRIEDVCWVHDRNARILARHVECRRRISGLRVDVPIQESRGRQCIRIERSRRRLLKHALGKGLVQAAFVG